jgi:hypothetical protein
MLECPEVVAVREQEPSAMAHGIEAEGKILTGGGMLSAERLGELLTIIPLSGREASERGTPDRVSLGRRGFGYPACLLGDEEISRITRNFWERLYEPIAGQQP